MTRMNLNTFQRHGVFADAEMVEIIADRLRDPEAIRKARVFPYQLLAAYKTAVANTAIPRQITEALQDAMEIATGNVPKIRGTVWIFPDVSGSMQSAVTGYRKGATSAVRCIDVAALVAASVLRRNPLAEVIPFSDSVVPVNLNPRDSVMTNANKLARLPSGGTNCSAPLYELNRRKASGDLIIYVSDNESWVDSTRRHEQRDRDHASMERVQNPKPGCEARLYRHSTLRSHPGQGARGHPEHRRLLGPGLQPDRRVCRGHDVGRSLGWGDRGG